MGINIYTLRSRTVSVVMPSGATVEANLFSYAYRLIFFYEDPCFLSKDEKRRARSYKAMTARAAALANKAMRSARSGLIVLGDADKLAGSTVHEGPTESLWYDCDKPVFGPILGFLRKNGRKWAVSLESEWRSTEVLQSDGSENAGPNNYSTGDREVRGAMSL
jgi:hypothetical protein